jgi:hypothetical protein
VEHSEELLQLGWLDLRILEAADDGHLVGNFVNKNFESDKIFV